MRPEPGAPTPEQAFAFPSDDGAGVRTMARSLRLAGGAFTEPRAPSAATTAACCRSMPGERSDTVPVAPGSFVR
jgi:hypothetical protein